MKTHKLIFTSLFLCNLLLVNAANGINDNKDNLVKYVSPLVGTASCNTDVCVAGHEAPAGYTFAGVTLPHGMTEWTAHTISGKDKGRMHGRVPYEYIHKYITGFIGTHYPSGAVMFDYGAVELMPITGELKYTPQQRASLYSHKNETSKANIYKVHLDDYNIDASVTATNSCAVLNFKYPKSESAKIIIDAMPSMYTAGAISDIVIDPIKNEVRGKSAMTGRAYRTTGYFVIRFNKKINSYGTYNMNDEYPEVIDNKYLYTEENGKLIHGIKGVYKKDTKFSNLVEERVDSVVDYDWAWYQPATNFGFTHYTVTWTGKLKAPTTGTYSLGIHSCEGAKLYIDGKLLIDDWKSHNYSYLGKQQEIYLEAGKLYDLKIVYHQDDKDWNAKVKLSWTRPEVKAMKSVQENNKGLELSTRIGSYLCFNTKEGEIIEVKVGTSFISEEQAAKNLDAEIGNKSFAQVNQENINTWNKELASIKIDNVSENDMATFYTAMYHSLLLPRRLTETGNVYRSPYDGKVYKGIMFTDYSLWDTFRATHPLLNILNPTLNGEMIQGLLNSYDQGGWLPKWPNPGYTNCMYGTHADAVISDAYIKGVRNFDVEKADEAMMKDAYQEGNYMAWGRLGIKDYLKLGYVPAYKYNEPVARTMEFAFDDYCIARFLEKRGDKKRMKIFDERSNNFKNVLDEKIRMVRARLVDGTWCDPYDNAISLWSGHDKNGCYNYKKNYTLCMPQNTDYLVKFLGGKDSLSGYLDEMFDKNIYYVGDEFSMHAPFLYNKTNEPWKTQKCVSHIVDSYYNGTPGGLPGNDDCGQVSSWYIFASLGFYPICPGSTEYEICTPRFPSINVRLTNGKEIIIKTNSNKKEDCYIQSIKLNGKRYNKSTIDHETLMKGCKLEFELGNTPNKKMFK